jgi:hypothetical protein
MTNRIEKIWNELTLLNQFPAHKRISADYPLDLYAEISSDGRVGLFGISTDEPTLPPKYDAVEVKIGRRADGRWAVSVVLARSELKPLFMRLCDDLIEAGSTFQPKCNAGHFVLSRIGRWRRLLSIGKDGLLSEKELQGLLGELLFLKTSMQLFGLKDSVEGWKGPFDAPRDFELPACAYEVKAIRYGSVTVHISSIDQLDVAGAQLRLVVYELTRTDPKNDVSITLPSAISDINKLLNQDENLFRDFEAKLISAGYVYRPEYQAIGFCVESCRYYEVTTNFPKLVRSALPHAVAEASYDLFLADCENCRLESIG